MFKSHPALIATASAAAQNFAWVMAPSEAEETRAAYLAKTPAL
jgi:hypothetical protein